jgi:hypothetical protein
MSSYLQVLANVSHVVFVAGRFFAGFGVGLVSALSESTPLHYPIRLND